MRIVRGLSGEIFAGDIARVSRWRLRGRGDVVDRDLRTLAGILAVDAKNLLVVHTKLLIGATEEPEGR